MDSYISQTPQEGSSFAKGSASERSKLQSISAKLSLSLAHAIFNLLHGLCESLFLTSKVEKGKVKDVKQDV